MKREAPLYWLPGSEQGRWHQHTLNGLRAVIPDTPICHLSLFEADAFARWAGARLPTEAEWEHAARSVDSQPSGMAHFSHREIYEPTVAPPQSDKGGLTQLFGDVWEWTSSNYSAYPGFRPAAGAVGEYNGKFMCNQYVLRGGSCVTPLGHVRTTYRNFFPADASWQFTGVRLARSR
jgi:ergothioneine biosynthesis protein EgtB